MQNRIHGSVAYGITAGDDIFHRGDYGYIRQYPLPVWASLCAVYELGREVKP